MYYMAVCDDQSASAEYITKTLHQKFTSLGQRVQFETYLDSVELQYDITQGQHFDALFLDIDMPELDGLNLGRFIKSALSSCVIVFVSNKETLVYQAFEVQPFRFCRKRVFSQEIDKLVADVLQELERREKRTIRIMDQSGKQTYAFDLNKLIYIEAQGKQCRIVTTTGEHQITAKFSEMDVLFSEHDFIKIHRSYTVNPVYIFRIEREVVELDNGEHLPLSRKRIDSVWEEFFTWSKKGGGQ